MSNAPLSLASLASLVIPSTKQRRHSHYESESSSASSSSSATTTAYSSGDEGGGASIQTSSSPLHPRASTLLRQQCPSSDLLEHITEGVEAKAFHSEEDQDETTRLYRAAVLNGRKRLLRLHELPDEWKGNDHILTGYRFTTNWPLIKSALGWHNETINIHSHFISFLILITLITFDLLPFPTVTKPLDRIAPGIFLVATAQMLSCSSVWHIFNGCAKSGHRRRAVCLDFLGISGLIAASLLCAEYYAFRCDPKLGTFYMTFTTLLGLVGMYIPWQPWFALRRFKARRVAFFVALAASSIVPICHLKLRFGVVRTLVWFFAPTAPSLLSYILGVIFYASQFPENVAPGRFDFIGASHQLWHFAIVAGVWLYWQAIQTWASRAAGGGALTCSLGGR